MNKSRIVEARPASSDRARSTERTRRYSYAHAFEHRQNNKDTLPTRRPRIHSNYRIEPSFDNRYVAASTYNPQLKSILSKNPRNLMYLRERMPEPVKRQPRTFERIGTISQKDEQDSIILDQSLLDCLADDIKNRMGQLLYRHVY